MPVTTNSAATGHSMSEAVRDTPAETKAESTSEAETQTQTESIALRCGYCQASLRGKYCHDCGVHTPRGRLTLPGMASDFLERVLQIESSVLRTTLHLLIRPRQVMQAFINGQRRYYTHPFTYMLLVGALMLLLLNLVYGDSFWQPFRQAMLRQAGDELSALQKQRYADFHALIYGFMPYWLMLFTLPQAALMRVLFWRRADTVANYWVLLLYASALSTLLGFLLSSLLQLAKLSMPLQMILLNLLVLLSQMYFMLLWLRFSLSALLRVLLATIVIFALMGTLQHGAASLYASWPAR